MKPLLLLIRTGKREFRDYLMRSISPHYRIHMFVEAELGWEHEYLAGLTRIKTMDVSAMIAAAKDLHATEPIAGVLCWDEARILQATQVAAALGLPGDAAAIGRCRDKHSTRKALAAAGVAQPQSVRVDSLAEARAAADRFGYPVIIKPTDLALSMGVVKVDTSEQLTAAFEHVSGLTHGGDPSWRPVILLEEFADGYEISVDSAIQAGEVFPLCLARKEIGYPPYCIETGHYVHGDEPLLRDPVMIKLLRDTHRALGFTDGITHTEIMMTETGPKIIEVNGRLGGDMIPYLGLLARGVDTGLAATAVACGRPPAVEPDRSLVAAVRFFFPRENRTRIDSIRFDFPDGPPPAIDQLVLLPEPGAVKSPPPEGTVNGRIAFATAVASTTQECREALDAAEAALVVNG